MKILVIACCKNEAAILPFFLRHYGQFADHIHIMDNASTDDSVAIVQAFSGSMPCEDGRFVRTSVEHYDSGGEMRDDWHQEAKSHSYKMLTEEPTWCVVVDCDEFIHTTHPGGIRDLLECYDQMGVVLPAVVGFDMVGDGTGGARGLPKDDGHTQLTDTCRWGVYNPIYSKAAVFMYDPGAAHPMDIGYGAGCHGCRAHSFPDIWKQSPTAEIKLLHYRWWSLENTAARARKCVLSEFNKSMGYGVGADDPTFQMNRHLELMEKRGVVL